MRCNQPVVTPPTTPPIAQPSSSAVTSLVLINASTQSELRTLAPVNTITRSIDGTALNIKANVTGSVKSVGFILDGRLIRTENEAPYSIAGDTAGVFASWSPSLGTHSLVVTSYSGRNRTGTVGASIAISFTVIAAPPVFVDTRPLNYLQTAINFPGGDPRVVQYTDGVPNDDNGDYWSDSGQVAWVPDGTLANDKGMGHHQTVAYYNGVFAMQPRWEPLRGSTPWIDAAFSKAEYIAANGGAMTQGICAQVRATNTTGNDALALLNNGLLFAATTQTGHGSVGWPSIKLPANKVVSDLAITSNGELGLIALYDTVAGTGQVAVVMIEAKGIPFHTFSKMGLPNQSSFSDFRLLGYVDVPMTGPFKIAAACNGNWNGPSDTNGLTLGQISFSSESHLTNLRSGAWTGAIATNGYAVVTSKTDNKLVVLDLSPIFAYIKAAWLTSVASSEVTRLAKAAGTWPQTFTENPSIVPTIAFTQTVTKPVSVIAGHSIDRWTPDRYKFHVGVEAGNLLIFDASPIMARFTYHRRGTAINQMGSFYVGENPCCIAFSRRSDGGTSTGLLTGTQRSDGQNNCMWVVCRGTKSVVEVLTVGGNGVAFRQIQDQRMNDPVACCTAVRGYVVLVCDYAGKKLFGFRVGTITDNRPVQRGTGPALTYPITNEGRFYQISGILSIQGNPYIVTSENVN